jgi:hypothetical protein
MVANEVTITSDNFTLEADGTVTAKAINITGGALSIPLSAAADAFFKAGVSGAGVLDSSGNGIRFYKDRLMYGDSSGSYGLLSVGNDLTRYLHGTWNIDKVVSPVIESSYEDYTVKIENGHIALRNYSNTGYTISDSMIAYTINNIGTGLIQIATKDSKISKRILLGDWYVGTKSNVTIDELIRRIEDLEGMVLL